MRRSNSKNSPKLHTYLSSRRLHHSLIFWGERVAGRSFLKALGRSLVCQHAIQDDTCQLCYRIESGAYPDILCYDRTNEVNEKQSSRIKVSMIRQMIEDMSLSPLEGKIKICFIESADLMTLEAANALLKILEDPAPHRYFVLQTKYPKSLPPTLVSRCLILSSDGIETDFNEEGCSHGGREEEALSERFLSIDKEWQSILLGRRENVDLQKQQTKAQVEAWLSYLQHWMRDELLEVQDPRGATHRRCTSRIPKSSSSFEKQSPDVTDYLYLYEKSIDIEKSFKSPIHFSLAIEQLMSHILESRKGL